GSATFSQFDSQTLRAVKSRKEICSLWNIRGGNASCRHDDRRVHACSFCGDKSHHAFSWTC
ncbi:hypothetical protein BDN72DRAFT_721139, partial [Pluteus cervinus]